jgi:hypothetical protein
MPAVVTTGSWATVTRVQTQPVKTTLVLRSYKTEGLPIAQKRLPTIELHLKTWNPKYTVTLLTEGVGEEKALVTDQTRDRLVYDRPAWKAPYDDTNANDDFRAPHRQDYSVIFRDSAHGIALKSGIGLDQHQDQTHRLRGPASAQGWSPQIKIVNTQGRVEVMACGIEGFETSRQKGVAA